MWDVSIFYFIFLFPFVMRTMRFSTMFARCLVLLVKVACTVEAVSVEQVGIDGHEV